MAKVKVTQPSAALPRAACLALALHVAAAAADGWDGSASASARVIQSSFTTSHLLFACVCVCVLWESG